MFAASQLYAVLVINGDKRPNDHAFEQIKNAMGKILPG